MFIIDTIHWQYSRVTNEQLTSAFASLPNCPALRELTVISSKHLARPVRTGILAALPLPQLTYLHLHTDDLLSPDEMQHFCAKLLTPNLTHCVLAVHELQDFTLFPALSSQRFPPQLTHCHICPIEAPKIRDWSWAAAMKRFRQRLGAVWCEKKDDVLRWRADRVWKRSVGLPDEAEEYAM